MREPQVSFRATVRESLYEEFTLYFPQFGANVWFLNMAMEQFLAEVRQHPSAVASMQAAIKTYVQRHSPAEANHDTPSA